MIISKSELTGLPLENQVRRIVWAAQGGLKFMELYVALSSLYQNEIEEFVDRLEDTIRNMRDVKILDYFWRQPGSDFSRHKMFVYMV